MRRLAEEEMSEDCWGCAELVLLRMISWVTRMKDEVELKPDPYPPVTRDAAWD